jgi:hypothetical protein
MATVAGECAAEKVGKLSEHPRKLFRFSAGKRRCAYFHLVDLKNINSIINEAFERQFCSGCLGL